MIFTSSIGSNSSGIIYRCSTGSFTILRQHSSPDPICIPASAVPTIFLKQLTKYVALRYRRVRGLYFLAVVFAAITIIHFARDCGRLVRSTTRRAGFAFGVSVENYKDW